MSQSYFHGWGNLEDIQVIESDGMRKVLVRGQLYMSWRFGDDASQRMAIVQLYNSGLGNREKLAEVFGVHINSVQNYITAFEKDGITGLVNQQSGPKESWKITPEIKFKILEIVFRNRNISYEQIVKVIEDRWGKNISINSIRQVLIENGFIEERIRKDGLWQQEEFFAKYEDKQSEINFSSGKDNQTPSLILNQYDKDCNYYSNTKDRSYYSQSQRIYLDQLKQGQYSAYAGGLLFNSLLERHNFLPTIKRVFDIERYEGYSLDELCLTLFYYDLFRFRSIEDFKTVYSEEFGILIGRISGPSIFTLRRFLHSIKDLDKSEELIDEFAKEYIKQGIARWGILYIDSHFLPYYGIYPITMGWHGVRKIPMKGSYNFLAVEEKFIPLLFLIRSSSEDLLQKIPEIILKAKKLAGEVGISKDRVENLTVIFDREGYSADLYRILDGRDSNNEGVKVKFISWAKYSDKWVNDIEDEKFDKTITVTYEIEKPEEIKYFETEKVMKRYGKIRTVVIESGKNKKRAAIYTNDNEAEAGKVIQLICRRWGEENLIKELLMKHLINYSPGYEAEEIEEQPMVENPKVKELKQKISNLKGELSQIKSKFGSDVLEDMAKKANWDEIKQKRLMTIAEIESIRSQITLFELEIAEYPEELKFNEAHNGKKLVEFNYGKKRFLDCIKVFAYNMERQMSDLLLNYYDIRKEIYPALSMIIRRGGFIKQEGGKLKVRLRRFKNPEIDYAARCLCEDLNQMDPFTLDKFHLPIYYEVE